MQDIIVMAFRKRLKKRGYRDVSIRRLKDEEKEIYLVTAVEPLGDTLISSKYGIMKMYHTFR